jgi:hypothetical protein
MVHAITHLRNLITVITSAALEVVQMGPDLPIDLFPRDTVSFSYIGDKFL